MKRWVLPLLAFAIPFLVLSQTIFSEWWLIDDHEVISFMTPNSQLSFAEAIEKFKSTEAFTPFHSGRYRPVYYALRLGEAVVLGPRPHAWHLGRILAYSIFSGSIVLLLMDFLPAIPIGLIGIWSLSGVGFGELFYRLGPSETYAAFGMLLCLFGFYSSWRRLWDERPVPEWTGLLILLGIVVGAGSKENFSFLAIGCMYSVYLSLKQRTSSGFYVASNILGIGFCAFIFLAVLIPNFQQGHDIYANPATAVSRLKILLQLPTHSIKFDFLLAMLLISKFWRDKLWLTGCQNRIQIFQLLILLFYVTQFVFYNGTYPTQSRYDFPGVFLLEIALALSVFGWWNAIAPTVFSDRTILRRSIGLAILATLLCSTIGRYLSMRKEGMANFESTKKFHSSYEQWKATTGFPESEYSLIYFQPLGDYEPLFSFRRFTQFDKVPGHFRVESIVPDDEKLGLSGLLSKNVEKVSLDGDVSNGFEAIANAPSRVECEAIYFTANAKSKRCKSEVQIMW